jgi:hypothetical protein
LNRHTATPQVDNSDPALSPQGRQVAQNGIGLNVTPSVSVAEQGNKVGFYRRLCPNVLMLA